jgi:hypothetical protein
LITSLIFTFGDVAVLAKTNPEKEARKTEKVKQGILKLGVGSEVLVRVKLKDKTKLDGYISEAGADSFVVTNGKSGIATVITYPQVKSIQGHNLSTGAKIAIGIGIAAAVVLVIYLVLRAKCGPDVSCLD